MNLRSIVLFQCCIFFNSTLLLANEQEISSKNPVKQIIIHSSLNKNSKVTIDLKKSSSKTVELELGDDWAGTVELVGPTKSDRLRVQLIYETSMSIQNEGPHLDLTEWKHFVSEAVTVWPEDRKDPGNHRFVISKNYIKEQSFPFITKAELIAAIREQTKKNKMESSWEKLAETCVAPQSYPCSVEVSKVWLQVYPEQQLSGKPLAEAVLILPMGC